MGWFTTGMTAQTAAETHKSARRLASLEEQLNLLNSQVARLVQLMEYQVQEDHNDRVRRSNDPS